MQKNVKNSLLLAILLCVLIISVSAVSAQELDDSNNNLAVSNDDESLSIENQGVDEVQSTDDEILTVNEEDGNVTGPDSGTGNVLSNDENSQTLNANPTVPAMSQAATGVVSGGADFAFVSPWSTATTGSLVYTVPEGVTNIKSAIVIVNVYSGSGAPTYALYSNVTLNTNKGLEVLGYEALALDAETAGDTSVYYVNDHSTKQYSDYQMIYDITSKVNNLNAGDTITIGVANSKYQDKLFDGRIKLISLFFAYDDGDNDKYTYWLNAGQVWTQGNANFNFLTSAYTGETDNITLRTIALSSSAAGSHKINNVVANPDSKSSSGFAIDNRWNNIESNFNKGSNTNLWFQTGGGSYKTNVGLLVAYAPEVEPSNEFYVNYETGSDSNIGTVANKPFKTIEHALSVVQNEGIIHITGVNYLDDVSIEGLAIDKNIDIVGSDDAVIDARGTGRIFKITANNVNITGITFKNANATGSSDNRGAALHVTGTTLNIDDCKFINNTGDAKSYGSALNLKSSTTTITNSVFDGNLAGYGGGAINAENSNVLLSIADSVFFNNGLPGTGWANGGVICSYNTVTITRSVFYNNILVSGKNGRSINQYGTGSLTITDSILLDGDKSVNVASGPVTLEGNWWGNNDTNKDTNPKDLGYTNADVGSYLYLNLTMKATGLSVDDTASVVINLLSTDGSEINVLDIPLTLTATNGVLDDDNLILDNGFAATTYTITADGDHNVTVDALGIKETHTLSVEDVVLNEVYVDYATGDDSNVGTSESTAFKTIEHALAVVEDYGIIHLIGTHYLDDVAADGLSITKNVAIIGDDDAVIDARGNGRIFKITANNVNITGITFKNANATGSSDNRGAALHVTGTTLNIDDCKFINNTGDAKSYGSALNLKSSTTTITNSVFVGNLAGYGGGAINAENSNVLLSIADSVFFNNGLPGTGWANGGVICSYNTVIITRSVFYNNILVSGKNGRSINQYGTGSLTITDSILLDGDKSVNVASGPVTLEGNWWGNNDTNKDTNPKDLGYTNADVGSYLYLNLTMEANGLDVGSKATVNVFLVSTDGSEVNVLDIPAGLTATNGTLDKNNITLVNGFATAEYTITANGDHNVTVDALGILDTYSLSSSDVVSIPVVYVDPDNGSDLNEGTSWDSAFETIEHALLYVADNGIVYITGVNYLDGVAADGLSINKNIAIVGIDGAVIDARGTGRIFKITANNVNITGITFKNANATGSSDNRGAALHVTGTTLNIDDCKFINNTGDAKSYGSALNLKSSTTTITNSVFDGNLAGYGGGAINAENSNVLLSIADSVFFNNGLPGTGWANGGVICSYNTVTITRSVFYNNILVSGKNGRSINQYGTGSLTITDSILLDGDKSVNVASGPVTLEGNWWGNNDTNKDTNPKDLGYTNANVGSYLYLNITAVATGLDVGDTANVEINLVSTDGSEVNVLDIPALLTATNGDLDKESVTLIKGSASAVYTITTSGNNTVTVNALGIEDTYSLSPTDVPSFEVVYVNATGGSDSNIGTSWETAVQTIEKAVSLVDPDGRIYVADGLYVLESAPASGVAITKNVAIYGESINAIISGNNQKRIFSVSKDSTLTIRNLTLTQGRHSGAGGAILLEDGGNTNPIVSGKIIISDSVISDSYSGTAGGAIGSNRGAIDNINNVTFINNYAPMGGALGVSQKGTITIGDNCAFIKNRANGRGSVTYAQAKVTVGKYNLFDSNLATGTYGYGAVFGYGFELGVGNVFVNNVATAGGALYLGGNSYSGAGYYCIFINNTDNNGRPVAKQNNNRPLTLDHCYWGTNDPDFSKLCNGAITRTDYLVLTVTADKESLAVGESAVVNVDLTKFNTGNNADVNSLPKSLPLVFTAVNGNVEPVNAELLSGVASTTYAPLVMGEGSATANIYTAAETVNFTVKAKAGTVFVNATGGSDDNDGSDWDTAVKTLDKALTLVAEDCVIYVADGVNYLEGVAADGLTIDKNISIIGMGDSVVIDANHAGRIFSIGANTVTLSNLVFINGNASNTADKRGGALYVNGATLTIDKCVFINNTVDVKSSYGGAINLKSSTTTITDSIFEGNSVWSTGGAINAENTNVLLNISRSEFIDNLILNNGWSAGAAICSYNTVVIDKSYFKGNRLTDTSRNGKSINQYQSGSLTITNSILLDGERGVWIATGPTTLENNWWGNNNTNKDISPKDLGYTNADVGNYYVLLSTLSSEDIYRGDLVTVTTTLKDLNGENANEFVLPLVITANLGSVVPNETYIIDESSSVYNATAVGDDEITVDVLGIKNVLNFTVKQELPDVSISGVTTKWGDGIYAGVNNTFTVKVNNAEGTSVENLVLELYSADDELLANYSIDSLAVGTSTFTLVDPTIRPITEETVWPAARDNKVNFKVNLVYKGEVASSLNITKALAYNGYLNKTYAYGGHDNIINRNYTINGEIIISTQDVSKYMDQYSRARNETWNIETPEGAQIVSVLLFFSYNWDTSYYPDGWNLQFNDAVLNGKNISYEKDRGNLGYYGSYNYGLVVFDVTEFYRVNDANTFAITKTGNCALYPSTLVVLYNVTDNVKEVKDVYFSDICDVYYPYYNNAGYENMTKTVVYYNNIASDATGAVWYAFGGSGGSNDADLSFNTKVIENAYKDQTDKHCAPYVADVSDVISENNEAWFITSSRSSTVVAYEQILVVSRPNPDYEPELNIPENVTAGDSVEISLSLPEDAEGAVTVYIAGKDYSTDVEKGYANFTIDELPIGNHTVVVAYSGDDKYDPVIVVNSLSVEAAEPTIEVSADSEDFVYDQPVTITVNLDEDATGHVLIDVDGQKLYADIVDGTATTEIPGIVIGLNNVTVTYTGDKKYGQGTASTNFTIHMAKVSIEAYVPEEAEVGEIIGVDVIVDPADATGNYSVFIDGVDVTGEYGELIIINGRGDFLLTDLANGTHTIGVRYNGDNNYAASEIANYTIVINKVDISDDIYIEGSSITYGENATVTFELPDDATGTVTVIVNGVDYTADVDGGVAVVEISGLDADIYENVVAKYSGDDKYEAYEGNATIEVEPLFVDWFLDNDDIYIDVNETITLNIYDVTEGGEGVINVTFNNEEYGIYTLEEALAGIEIEGFDAPGEYIVVFAFVENPNFDYAEPVDVWVFVNYIDPNMNVTVPSDVEVGEIADITVELPDDATGNVTVSVDGVEIDTVPVENGEATVSLSDLTAGNHSVKVVYSGDDVYEMQINETTLTISKAEPTVVAKADNITVGEDAVITVTVDSDATNYVLVDIAGQKLYAEIENGQASVTVSGLTAGNQTATVKYVGDDKYNETTVSVTFAVNKVEDYDVEINASGNTDNTTVTVDLPKDATGNVTVTDDNGNNYTSPVENGQASVDVPNLPEGENNLTVSYTGDDKYAPVSNTTTVNVTKAMIDTVLSGEKLVMIVGDGSKFTVTLTDKDGNPIAGKGIKVTIAGKTYTIKTGSDGKASLPINLKAGSYDVTAVFNGDSQYSASNVVSTSVEVYTNVRIVENKDLVKTYGSSDKFTVRALDKYGKPVGAYAKVKMTIAGKTYTVNTDANGYASLPINLKVGTYKITTEYGGTTVTNTVTVKK